MELRFAVVEDRLPDAQRLESLLRLAFGGGQPLVCDHYESGDAFLAAFPSKEYQVIFLDICMEGTNGIETARILRRADPDLLLVFVTSSPEYVWDAFPVHPFDYLLKPYREEKLFQLADELRRVLFRAEPELEVRIARQQVHLPLRKIQYAMAQNHYVRIVSDDSREAPAVFKYNGYYYLLTSGKCRAVSTFSQVEQLLRAQENFIVCNRGVILNMDKVLRLDCDCFEMLDGTCLPVRQKDKNSLFAQFTQYQFRHMRREL
jgi:two-component system LytT family response regulator